MLAAADPSWRAAFLAAEAARLTLALPAAWMLASQVALWLPSPAAAESSYVHNRVDYAAFRERFPELLEPNYLPFMTYRLPVPPRTGFGRLRQRLPAWLGGTEPREALVFCHWEQTDLPLAVFIEPPTLEQDELTLRPRPPESYVAAVERALEIWERDLEGAVRFRRAERSEDATLVVRLLGSEAPPTQADVQVLGTAPMRRACQALGRTDEPERLRVRYRLEELRVYLADQHGLLLPDQVERVALHELGHALGMPGHSPVPADLLFPVARDRLGPDGLGAEDVHSFLALYAIPSGTIYTELDAETPGSVPPLPEGPPRLALAPHVDPRLGFEIQPPQGWLRVATPYGLALVDGVSWDYEASLQIVVRRFDTLEEYLERHGPAHLGTSRVRSMGELRVAGRRAKRVVLETDRDSVEELTFLETGDGRVLIAIAECPAERHALFSPWFAASLASLEVSDAEPSDAGRDYGERAPAPDSAERVPAPD